MTVHATGSRVAICSDQYTAIRDGRVGKNVDALARACFRNRPRSRVPPCLSTGSGLQKHFALRLRLVIQFSSELAIVVHARSRARGLGEPPAQPAPLATGRPKRSREAACNPLEGSVVDIVAFGGSYIEPANNSRQAEVD